MLHGLLLAALLSQPWPADLGYPGRFAPLRAVGRRDTVMVANATYELSVERVLKAHALVGRRVGDTYGQRVYAGSFALGIPEGRWCFDLPDAARRTEAAYPGPLQARVTQRLSAQGWAGEMSAEIAADYPALWLSLRRTAGSAPLAGGLLGYGWANRKAPAEWSVGGTPLARLAGRKTPVISEAAPDLLLTCRDEAGFTGVLAFSPAPSEAALDDDGFTWRYAPGVAEARVLYILLPGSPEAGTSAALARGLERAPEGLRHDFGETAGRSWLEVSAASAGMLALPPGVADLAPAGAIRIPTTAGTVALVPGPRVRVALDAPPLVEKLLPEFSALPAASQARVEAWVCGVLDAQEASGAFRFGLGRAFYDGITCCVLAEVLSLLNGDLRERTRQGLEKGLRHFWRDQKECQAWPGIMLPPEQEGFTQGAVDYPEIQACVLQATALYAAAADREYARRHWPEIRRQAEQLRLFMDPGGIALAAPGPEYCHAIAESAIGGYLAWQAVYQLAQMAGQPGWAAEARARAALAWRAWHATFGWRPEFGEPVGVVNGINQGIVECLRDPAYTYVQSTWFTHLPCFALPREDRFGVWRLLEAQPWWEWTRRLKSTQCAYDACNAIALARAGDGESARQHWPEVSARPSRWATFDEAPVLAIAAEAWLSSQ